MATELYNEGPCVRVIKNGQEFLVIKVQVKRIDMLQGNLVRIDIGEGALKHIYLEVNDIVVPDVFNDIFTLRDILLSWIKQYDVLSETRYQEEISQLQSIRQALEAIVFGGGVNSSVIMEPLRQDESQPNIIYKGYAVPDAQTYDAVWAIVRISRIDDQIIYEWADGNQLYDNVWDDRYSLNYSAGVKGPTRK